MKKTVLLFLSSVAFALVLGEVFVRVFAHPRNVGPGFTDYDSTYGKRHKKNFTGTRITPEFSFQLTTNSLGFRGPELKKFPERGILFLGDSFTEGYGVTDGEEFPALIRQKLDSRYGSDSIPVLNAGSGGYGQSQPLKFLQKEGRHYNPRLVVLQVMENDFHDDLYEGMYALDKSDKVVDLAIPGPPFMLKIRNIIESVPGLSYSYLFALAREAYWSDRVQAGTDWLSKSDTKESDHLTHRIVGEILDLCKRENWHIIVVYASYLGGRSDQLKKITESYNVPFYHPPHRKDNPELYYKTDAHWSAAGHRLVGDQVMRLIENSGVLPQ